MHLEIVTPENLVSKEEIDKLTVPTSMGEITILPGHMPLVTRIGEGEIIITTKNKSSYLAVTGGFLQISGDTITLLADFAIRSEEINTQRVLEAKKRAEEQLKKRGEDMSERDFATAQAEMRKAILELKISSKRRRSSSIPNQ